ncbi:zinc finger protein [Trypanosoma theileri]|uniref:Zinc finger protein n=1 Tax=Trypanosoma theileri TaxID=67003 RepID=A0A1X0P2R0_9TRYP|nr:zinc finger protein [Trypanosoma theileri]ORC90839.1 zinc finger protein [Trypanosoma theileri]
MTAALGLNNKEQSHIITCGLCFNVLKDPLTFDCQHSYCAACVRSKIESQHCEGFACPLCNVVYANVTLRNLDKFADGELSSQVELMAGGADAKLICQWCEEAPAVIQCNECMYVYCVECNTAVHKSAAKRGHMTGKIADPHALKGIQKKCSVRGHEEYRAEFYCTVCEEICCAYCLQVGPHKNHENIGIARAASEIRQKMSRDMVVFTQTKARMETQASELNRVTAQYFNSYDSVENIITERFNHFRQQLMQREVELRKTLATLRDSGDASLTSSRKLFLMKLNALNEAMLRFQHMQHGGSDHEVLESRSLVYNYLKNEIPSIVGSGFKISDLGDITISGLDIMLDLQAVHPSGSQSSDAPYALTLNGPPSGGLSTRHPSEAMNEGRRPSVGGNGVPQQIPQHPLHPDTPLRLSFPVDDDVEATVKSDGVLLRCVARGGQTQIGVRSKETMENVACLFPEDGGFVTWRVRLESISESFLGVVEKTDAGSVPDGFYWRPTRSGVFDGRIGRLSPLINQLPVCRNGDVICFTYDIQKGTLRVSVNGNDHSVVLSDVHPRIAACFIFYPGEALTVLF